MNERSRSRWLMAITVVAAVAAAWLASDPDTAASPLLLQPMR